MAHWKQQYIISKFTTRRTSMMCMSQWLRLHDLNEIVKQFKEEHASSGTARCFKRWRAMYIGKIIFGKSSKGRVRELFGRWRQAISERKLAVEDMRARVLSRGM